MKNPVFLREIFLYEDYYNGFFKNLSPVVQKKFNWVLQLVSTLPVIPEKFFKHISGSDGLYEIRIEVSGNNYRIFAFFDEGKIIVLLNVFQKKSMKLPSKELELAKKLKSKYFSEKQNQGKP